MIMKEASTGRVVGYSRWFMESGIGEGRRNGVTRWEERWLGDELKLAEGMSMEVMGDGFFEPMQRQHEVVIGGRRHFCKPLALSTEENSLMGEIVLEVLATHPEFQKKGVASRLLEWGCEKMDREGAEGYLDSSVMGKPVYEKFGWVAREEVKDEKAISVPMLRPKKVDV